MDNLYLKTIKKELTAWEKKMQKKPSLTNRASKAIQEKIQNLVPDKVQNLITAAVKTMIETVISGSGLITKTEQTLKPSLAESDFLVTQAFSVYHKTAVAQGIGFGLGGVLINLADLPALLLVKTKFLFDCAKLYGFDISDDKERMFMLYVFQLAYCCDRRRLEIFPIIKNWDTESAEIEWEKLQTEYRDYMDIAKLLQLLPVVGAVAGGAANHRLMNKLKVTAMNCYRMRVLQ
ncbi:MAG: EcsC family protein [Defluviitaleaceae bacterium]|nr:EcsC family protein [Defluviitaleaceae bacterium]